MAKSNLVHSHDFRLLLVVNGLAMTKTLVNYFHGSWCWLQARMDNYYENRTLDSGFRRYGTTYIFVLQGAAGKRHGRLLRVVNGLAMTKTLVNYFHGSWCWLQARMGNYYENRTLDSGFRRYGTTYIFILQGAAGKRHGRLLQVSREFAMTKWKGGKRGRGETGREGEF